MDRRNRLVLGDPALLREYASAGWTVDDVVFAHRVSRSEVLAATGRYAIMLAPVLLKATEAGGSSWPAPAFGEIGGAFLTVSSSWEATVRAHHAKATTGISHDL